MGISRFGSYCAFAVCEFYKRAERHGGSHQALDYAGCVLNNWERIDPLGPVSPQNVRLLRRFTGLVDEEWFFKTHIIIE
ncbi:unnamed protein product, partial [Effrenium voratum]